MDRKNQRLNEILEKLNSIEPVSLNGRLVLGNIVGNLRLEGFLEPTREYHGDLNVVRTEKGYEFKPKDSEPATILTNKKWILVKNIYLPYATKLRRGLRNCPHLMLNATDKNQQKYQFAILYDVCEKRNHQ